MSERIKPGEWHDYVTKAPHGSPTRNYGPGTPCKVSRDEKGRLLLKFEDEIVTLTEHYYAFGIERTAKEIGEFFLAY
jgi:hypothetical protein